MLTCLDSPTMFDILVSVLDYLAFTLPEMLDS